jgi:anti-sigma B factor antagonist
MKWSLDASKRGPIAYVGAFFFGGEGGQSAVVCRDGKTVLGPVDSGDAINQALRILGVSADEGMDEFDIVGLGRRRRTYDWVALDSLVRYAGWTVRDALNFLKHAEQKVARHAATSKDLAQAQQRVRWARGLLRSMAADIRIMEEQLGTHRGERWLCQRLRGDLPRDAFLEETPGEARKLLESLGVGPGGGQPATDMVTSPQEPAEPRPGLTITAREKQGITVLDLDGKLSLDNCQNLHDQTTRLLNAGNKAILLNLARLRHIDAAGLGTLLNFLAKARATGGELKLVNVTGEVHKILKATGVADTIEIYSDEEEAAASFTRDSRP